ncbi:hypothetical protein MMC24_002699 [Lignoscripta atroalba]|nr:hypothetical protein [Lignoscripta atroalba]
MEEAERTLNQGQRKADHLCVLVHGLWGNPKHLSYLATTLRETYPEEELQILVAKRNSDSFTYDGIDLGGERVAHEIEDALEELARKGQPIKKLSMVGYSLGGLVARYAMGLLYSKGWFDKLEPVNFTTFASPHLGVRTPRRGYQSHLWNILGGNTLSSSGRQLFLIDQFRDTKRPLLSVLADPNSIFIKALARFKHRVLYANIVNDRSAPYYTTYISKVDPFDDIESIDVRYLKGYEPVIVDANEPIELKEQKDTSQIYARVLNTSRNFISRLPLFALLTVLVPVGSVVFLINSGVQSIRSQQRIRLHEAGKAGIGLGSYRIPLMVENARSAVEGAFENYTAGQHPEYLHDSDEEAAGSDEHQAITTPRPSNGVATTDSSADEEEEKPSESPSRPSTTTAPLIRVRSRHHHEFPTLALSPEQFSMIDALDAVGIKKYPVHIHKVGHSHAAIIVRRQAKGFEEGKVVVKHWLDEEFEI